MAKLLDIPFYCLPFMLLAQLTTISKECCMRSREAMKVKDRGQELAKYLAALSPEARNTKIGRLFNMDMWYIWMHLAIKIFGPMPQATMTFLKTAPMTVDVCTTHRNNVFHIEVSAQHYMDILAPHMLFATLDNMLKPSVYDVVQNIKIILNFLIGGGATYDELWWRTSPITFYEVDMVHNVYYQYADVTLAYINGDVSTSIPHRRTRVQADVIRNELTSLLAYYQM